MVITFNTDVVVGLYARDIIIRRASDNSIFEPIEPEFASINEAVVTINPTTTLDFNTEYYVQIANGAFKDASNNYYGGISSTTIWSFTTVDAFTVSKTTASVSETGSEDSFTVVLNSQPENNVVFNITSADTDETTVDLATLTFTSANWNIAQTVTLTGVDDSSVDGSQDTTITISVDDDQSDNAFDATADKTVTVSTTDDDSVGITLDKSSLNLAENGGSDTFTITLNTTPTDEVTVQLTTTDNCTLSTDYVVLYSMSGFDPTVEVEVTVRAVDDNIDNATDRTCTINTGDPASADSNYGDLLADAVANVSVTITDNDSAGFTLSKTGASVTEAGGTDSFTVVLNSQPTMDVVFDIASADTDEATVSPDTLTFTTANWDIAQTVTLTGEDDSVFDGSQNTTITISVDDSQSDNAFDATADKTVTVTTTDDDSVGIILDKSSLILAENSGSDTFTINLNTTPTHDVTVPLTTTENCTLSTVSVVLDSMSGVDVTVTAIDDSIVDATDRTCTINTGDPTSADSNYGDLVADNILNVSVTLTDDDIAPKPTPPVVVVPEVIPDKVVEVIKEEEETVEPTPEPAKKVILEQRPTGNAEQTGTKPELNNVAKLYIATFGRAPESAGSNYWLYESKLSLEDIARSFFEQEETKGKYPEGFSNYDFIIAIYNHVYNRDPDQAGGDYWLNDLDKGYIERPLFILAVINGAKGDDLEMLEKQTIVGVNFATNGNGDLDLAKRIIDDLR